MFWILLLLYFGGAIVWANSSVWTLFGWPRHLIVDNDDPKNDECKTFRTYARHQLDPVVVVPFAITWPFFFFIGIFCWLYVGIMRLLIPLWALALALWPKKKPHAQAQG